MCTGKALPAWQAQVLESLLEIPGVEVSVLIVPGSKRSRSKLAILAGDPQHLLWNLYNKIFVQRRSPASRPVDMGTQLSGAPEIRCTTEPVGKYGERFGDDDLASIQGFNLDVILRFAFGILKGPILESARYGIWSFHHGDEREYRGQPPGFWEVVDGQSTVGTILQRITERLDGGTVLHRGLFKVTPHSYRRTRDGAFLGAVDFPSIEVRRIMAGDTSAVDAEPSTTTAPLRRSPGNWTMVMFFARQVLAFLRSQWIGLGRASKWTVGVIDRPVTDLLDERPIDVAWVPEQGANRYLADPFPDPTGKTSFVLVEDYDHVSHRGVISAIDLDGKGQAEVVLDTGVHASYPYLFEHDGSVFCVPETYQARQVRIYRATSFPDRWELTDTILDGLPVLDPTVFRHEGRWWLFCTFEGPHANTALHVFHAEQLSGPWSPHALNPVKTDISSSRPGGTPFVHDGALYRPAQDSSASYGGAIAINEVEVLTPNEFSETVVRRIGPLTSGPYRAGIHTIAGRGGLTVVDGRRDVFIFSSFRREFVGRIRQVLKRG